MKHHTPSRPPTSAALACAAGKKSHAPLRGEEGRHVSDCALCSVPIERDTRTRRDYWLAFCWTLLIEEDPV